MTSTPATAFSGVPSALANIKRSKPLKYAYEKEIVLYAHHRALDYFSTECVYSPEAFRGSARALVKNLERVRPSAILDLVRSGEDMARLCPGFEESSCAGACAPEEDGAEAGCGSSKGRDGGGEMERVEKMLAGVDVNGNGSEEQKGVEIEVKEQRRPVKPRPAKKQPTRQVVGTCEKCGYMSSQRICKACVLSTLR